MKQRIVGMILVAVLALSFSALAAPPQVALQKGEMKKGEMKAAPKEMSKDLKEVACDPACGFMIRSHDEKEIVDATMRHAQKVHGKKISATDVRGMMKTVAAQAEKEPK
jgi:predicted small metal-binding protein